MKDKILKTELPNKIAAINPMNKGSIKGISS